MSRRLSVFVSSLALAAYAVPALAQNPIRTVDPTTGHTYDVSQNVALWTDAVNEAKLLSVRGIPGHLVTLGSQAENNFVLRFWQPFTNTVWIGFTDFDAAPLAYHWANNEPITYTNWSIGEPNNSQGLEHYAQMFQSNGTWNDLPNTSLNYIIEYDTLLPPPPGVPEPGAFAFAASAMTFGAMVFNRRRKRDK